MTASRTAKQSTMLLERALEQLSELESFIETRRPFKYILETDVLNGSHSMFPQRDEDEIDVVSIRCSEVITSMRVAIEYAYCAVVGLRVEEVKQKKIQFPTSPSEEKLKKTCRDRLAFEVGQEFVDEIMELRPHGGKDGDADLYFICSMNNDAKHGRIVPMGYYADIVVGELRKQIPDFPHFFSDETSITVGNSSGSDFKWSGPSMNTQEPTINKVPADGKLRREIDVQVRIAFQGRTTNYRIHVVESLHDLYAVAEKTVSAILRHL